MNINFIAKHTAVTITIFIFILLIQTACSSRLFATREERNKAEADLDSICNRLSVPDKFTYINSEKHLDIGKVAIFKKYKAEMSCKDAGEHFRNYFLEQGWNREQMSERVSKGGMSTIDFDFRNNDYLVSIACERAVAENANKQFWISCSWGLR
jgi:hypothetical protein